MRNFSPDDRHFGIEPGLHEPFQQGTPNDHCATFGIGDGKQVNDFAEFDT